MQDGYKIRDRRTGLFSTGDSATLPAFHYYDSRHSWDRFRYFNAWTREGKTWNSLSMVKQHLNLFGRSLPKQLEVVRLETVENGMISVSVVEMKNDHLDIAPATIDCYSEKDGQLNERSLSCAV